MFRQRTVPRGAAPPALIDYRLWSDRRRLNYALSGIFEVREQADLTLTGFSSWDENGKTLWAHVIFNRKNQLLSVQIHPEAEIEALMDRGVAIWKESEKSQESPALKLRQESLDLFTAAAEQSVA
jgi:hypothetical protein